jgi:hypothetical protein
MSDEKNLELSSMISESFHHSSLGKGGRGKIGDILIKEKVTGGK